MGLNLNYIFGKEALSRIEKSLNQAKGRDQEKICDLIAALDKRIEKCKKS